MLRTPTAFAAHPQELVPQIIPLDESADSLGAFAPEQAPPPAPPPAAARPRAVTLRVPKWAGTGGLAILGGALSGLVIVATLGPSVGAAGPPTGAITITSEPAGLPISLDDVAHGVTPATAVVAAGRHRVRVGAGADVRERRLHVPPGGESAIHLEWPAAPAPPEPSAAAHPADPVAAPVAAPSGRANPESIAPRDRVEAARARATPTTASQPAPTGWLSVTSAFPVQVYENGVEVVRDRSGRLPLAAGPHALTLVNDALEFRQEQEVTIVARRAVSVALDTPSGVLHVNAQPWATVWVDGRRVGDTPMGNLALPIGEHEVVLRHPTLGEERRSVSVGARTPVRVGVEFKP